MTWTIKQRGAATGLMLADFLCADHGRFEATVERGADEAPCPACGAGSPWTPSPIVARVKLGEVSRGSVGQAFPGAVDTRALAEGMPLNEWKERRAKARKEARRKQVKEMIG